MFFLRSFSMTHLSSPPSSFESFLFLALVNTGEDFHERFLLHSLSEGALLEHVRSTKTGNRDQRKRRVGESSR